jgi:hypothetical protein
LFRDRHLRRSGSNAGGARRADTLERPADLVKADRRQRGCLGMAFRAVAFRIMLGQPLQVIEDGIPVLVRLRCSNDGRANHLDFVALQP